MEKGVHFVPHSAFHNILSKVDPTMMEREITVFWIRMKSELNNPQKIFRYPKGSAVDFGNREIALLKDKGSIGAASAISDIVKYKSDSDDCICSLPKLPLPDNMPEFIQCWGWQERARAMLA